MRGKITTHLCSIVAALVYSSLVFAQSASLEAVDQAKRRTDLIFTLGFPVAIALYILFRIYRRKVNIKKMELGEDWLPHRPGPLVLRFADNSLNRIKIGEPFQALKALGRPDNPSPVFHDQFHYHGSGLAISLLRGEIVDFDFNFRRTTGNFMPARIALLGESGEIELSQATRIDDVRRFLPNPSFEEKYEDGSSELSYDNGRKHLNFCFDDAGRLEALMVFRLDKDEA